MRVASWILLAASFLHAPGCSSPPPVAPLAHVSEARAVRVRFVPRSFDEAETEAMRAERHEAIEGFDRTLTETLRRAGYEVTETGPYDVRVRREIRFHAEHRRGRHNFVQLRDITRVVFHVFDAKRNELDRFEYRATEGMAPATEPERVAIDLVNAMTTSPKVGSYAESRTAARRRGPVEEPADDTQEAPR